jgi:hypothetical protein
MPLVVKGAFLATPTVSACMADVIDFASWTSTTNSTGNPTVAAGWAPALASSIRISARGDMTERGSEVSLS